MSFLLFTYYRSIDSGQALRLIVGVFFLCSLLCGLYPAHAEDVSGLVKAGFITKFPSFVEWPEPIAKRQKHKFVIGVLGKTPITKHLHQVLEHSEKPNGIREIKQLKDLKEVGECDILFISGSKKKQIIEILKHTENSPILTVGDTPGFSSKGVLINFFLENGQIRFEINKSAIPSSGLSFNFRLFQVAKVSTSEEVP